MKIINKKIAKSKSSSSWLIRQLNDEYVKKAKKEGFRSRAVYKLIQINEKYKFLKQGLTIVDLGCAPGSWSEYIAKNFNKCKIYAIDLLDIKPIADVNFFKGDFTSDEAINWLDNSLNNKKIDLLLSDMAPNTVGHTKTDHLRQMALLEMVTDFAKNKLKVGGVLLAKSFTGGTTNNLLQELKKMFKTVKHIKPDSSRKESVEMFILCLDFKGI